MMKENDWQLMRYFLLWLVLLFMVALSFYGIFRLCRNIFKKTCYNFFAIISFALLPSSRSNLHVYLRLLCQIPIIEMPALNRNEKNTCENCATHVTKLNLARHKKSCSPGICSVPNIPISSQKSKMMWIIVLLRSIAPQNLISSSSVNFVI